MSDQRNLSPWHLAALIVASMIGSGVFTTSGYALADLQSRELVVLAWFIGMGHAALGAIAYGWLAKIHPESGGEYILLDRTVHPAAGYIAGWVSVLAGFTAPIAAAAHGLEAYLQQDGALWIGATAIVLSTAIHGIKRGLGAGLQTLAVGIKLTLLVVFAVWGASVIEAPAVAQAEPEWGLLGPTLVWVSFSYSGWNAAIYLAGEVREGAVKHLAWWGLGAVGIVGTLYIVLNAIFVYSAPIEVLAGRPDVGVAAAEALGGSDVALALSLVVALGLATSVSSMIMSGPRVMWKMGREGALPAFIGRGDETPTIAIITQGALALIAFFISDLQELLGYIGLTLSLSSALTVSGLFFEKHRGNYEFPNAIATVVPALFILGTVAMAAWLVLLNPWQALASFATIAVGLVAWFLSERRTTPS